MPEHGPLPCEVLHFCGLTKDHDAVSPRSCAFSLSIVVTPTGHRLGVCPLHPNQAMDLFCETWCHFFPCTLFLTPCVNSAIIICDVTFLQLGIFFLTRSNRHVPFRKSTATTISILSQMSSKSTKRSSRGARARIIDLPADTQWADGSSKNADWGGGGGSH